MTKRKKAIFRTLLDLFATIIKKMRPFCRISFGALSHSLTPSSPQSFIKTHTRNVPDNTRPYLDHIYTIPRPYKVRHPTLRVRLDHFFFTLILYYIFIYNILFILPLIPRCPLFASFASEKSSPKNSHLISTLDKMKNYKQNLLFSLEKFGQFKKKLYLCTLFSL